MVKITPYIPSRNVTPSQPSKGVEPVNPSAADKSVMEKPAPFVERRKKQDRRGSSSTRGAYEMRSGKDRRKHNRGRPSIDTDV